MGNYVMANEPITNKPRTLNIENININVGFSTTLLDTEGSIIMQSKTENLSIGSYAQGPIGGVEDPKLGAKKALLEEIELLVAEFLNQ